VEDFLILFLDDEDDEFARNTDGNEELLGGDATTAVAATVIETAPEFMFISLLLLQCASRWISGGKGASLERRCMLLLELRLLLHLLAGNGSSCAIVVLGLFEARTK
jgi:hypothetical protein